MVRRTYDRTDEARHCIACGKHCGFHGLIRWLRASQRCRACRESLPLQLFDPTAYPERIRTDGPAIDWSRIGAKKN